MVRQASRPRVLVALALWFMASVLAVLSPTALAQDPRITEAQRVAREWLVLSDGGDTRATYAGASAKFRGAMTLEQWVDASAKARAPYGAVKQRSLASSQAALQAPNMPDGTYVLLIYRTNFANRDASETITMEREADGVWRLVGYSIR